MRKKKLKTITIPFEQIISARKLDFEIAESDILDFLDCHRAFYHKKIKYEIPKGIGIGREEFRNIDEFLGRLREIKHKKVRWFNLTIEFRDTKEENIKDLVNLKIISKY